MNMQKTGILERKALILLSLTILTLILTAALATPTLAEEDKTVDVEKGKVDLVISMVKVDGKIHVTISINNGIIEIILDPPGGTPGLP
ncbi:MAG: hypothetical protein MRT15_10690 [archaeon YNP-LCB-003-016]|nr:hypothetical protein [Candidatus Culexarchaeum yellowstonense]